MLRRSLFLLALLATLLVAAPAARAASGLEVGIQDEAVLLPRLKVGNVFQGYWGYAPDTYKAAKSFRATYVRVMVGWSETLPPSQVKLKKAPKKKNYTWALYDRMIDQAKANGFKLEFVLNGPTPAWADGQKKVRRIPYRPNATEYGKWVYSAVKHFSAKGVKRYSIWNEPNHAGSLTPLKETPQIYRALYKAGYAQARKASKSAELLIGETAPYQKTGQSLAPLAFLRQVLCVSADYRTRSKRCPKFQANGYAHHPYDNFFPPTRSRSGRDNSTIGSIPRLTTALDKLAKVGALRKATGGKMPVYLTEYGYFSTTANTNTVAVKPESKRATYARDSFTKAYNNPRVKQLTWYQIVEPPKTRGTYASSWLSFIMNLNGQPMETYNALVSWAKGKNLAK
jgi:hypothetical protein